MKDWTEAVSEIDINIDISIEDEKIIDKEYQALVNTPKSMLDVPQNQFYDVDIDPFENTMSFLQVNKPDINTSITLESFNLLGNEESFDIMTIKNDTEKL